MGRKKNRIAVSVASTGVKVNAGTLPVQWLTLRVNYIQRGQGRNFTDNALKQPVSLLPTTLLGLS